MTTALKPQPVPVRPAYRPILSARERRAYQTAYRLLAEFDVRPHTGAFAGTPGASRSRLVDRLAALLLEG
jgi:hypothetical protein